MLTEVSFLWKGSAKVLVSTDIASRGIDFAVNHVVQYECAPNAVTMLHRAGRTARAGRSGHS